MDNIGEDTTPIGIIVTDQNGQQSYFHAGKVGNCINAISDGELCIGYHPTTLYIGDGKTANEVKEIRVIVSSDRLEAGEVYDPTDTVFVACTIAVAIMLVLLAVKFMPAIFGWYDDIADNIRDRIRRRRHK